MFLLKIFLLKVLFIYQSILTYPLNDTNFIKEFKVEKQVYVGDQTFLKCLFKLPPFRELVNLKWYVNGSEFYRYENLKKKSENPIKYFNVKGVHVDRQNSGVSPNTGSVLKLINITPLTRGTYKCEVTTDPNFITAEKVSEMEVLSHKNFLASKSNGISNMRSSFNWFLILLSIIIRYEIILYYV